MHHDPIVRPRRVWAGVTAALVGATVLGLGITDWMIVPTVTGSAILAAGMVTAVAGGVLYDTHGARPVRAELRGPSRLTVHDGTVPGEMSATCHSGPRPVATSRTTSRVLADRATSARPAYTRAAAALLLAAAVFVLCSQGLYAHSPRAGQRCPRPRAGDRHRARAASACRRQPSGTAAGPPWPRSGGLALARHGAILSPHDRTASTIVGAVAATGVVFAAGALPRPPRGAPMMPIWLQAGLWGLLAGRALVIGAAIAWWIPVPRRSSPR